MTPPPSTPNALGAVRVRLHNWASAGLMPFREARPLPPHERRRVATLWAAAGGGFSLLWSAALVLALPGLRGLAAIVAVVTLSALGALFFALVALTIVGAFSRAFGRPSAGQPDRPSEQPRLTRDRQPLPLDTE